MQALSIAFHAIVPLFLIIALGFGVKRLGWIGPEDVRRFNKVCFYTFMPVMLFYNIYTSDFSHAVRLPYALFVVGMALAMILLAFLITLAAEKTPERRGVMIQAAFRSNFVLLGLPIAEELLPNANFGVTALMIAIVVPIYNMMSVVVLEYFRGGKPKLGEVLLGASFEVRHIARYKKQLLVCVGLRLLVFPGAILTLAAAVGLRDIEFVTLLAMTAAPIAVNSFNMAQQLGGDSELAGSAVVISTAGSFFTLFLWITLFKQLDMF